MSIEIEVDWLTVVNVIQGRYYSGITTRRCHVCNGNIMYELNDNGELDCYCLCCNRAENIQRSSKVQRRSVGQHNPFKTIAKKQAVATQDYYTYSVEQVSTLTGMSKWMVTSWANKKLRAIKKRNVWYYHKLDVEDLLDEMQMVGNTR